MSVKLEALALAHDIARQLAALDEVRARMVPLSRHTLAATCEKWPGSTEVWTQTVTLGDAVVRNALDAQRAALVDALRGLGVEVPE